MKNIKDILTIRDELDEVREGVNEVSSLINVLSVAIDESAKDEIEIPALQSSLNGLFKYLGSVDSLLHNACKQLEAYELATSKGGVCCE